MRHWLLSILLVQLVCMRSAPAGEENLVGNGSFEAGMTGWQFADRPAKTAYSYGRGEIVRDHVRQGPAAFYMEKSRDDLPFPQLSLRPVAIVAGGYYQLSAWLDSTQPVLAQCVFEQPKSKLLRTIVFPPTRGWKRVSAGWHAPPDARRLWATLGIPKKKGQMWLTAVQLQRVAPFEDQGESLGLEAAKADPIHGLTQLALRRRVKPFDLLKSPSGDYPSERVVFRDTVTGTVLWKMSHNPGYNRHIYSNIPVWNADGSKMALRSDGRPGRGRWWLVEPDCSRWSPLEQEFRFWSPVNPHIAYASDESLRKGPVEMEILQVDVASGEVRRLWQLPLEKWRLPPGKRDWKLLPASQDGKKFLIRQTDRLADGTARSFAVLLNTDGTGEPQRFDLGVEAGQIWFLKRADHSFMFNDAIGKNGVYQGCQWIGEPAQGGRVCVLDAFRAYNHAGVSPSGKYVAFQRYGLWIVDIDSGSVRLRVPGGVLGRPGGEHLSWECDDRWLVASMGNTITEVWTDEDRTRLLCVPHTQHQKSAECEPESSPDGTKVGYASTMMGDLDFYVAVQRLPDPPQNVRRQGHRLTWDPPKRCRELAGYCVYRGAELLNRRPLRDCRYDVPAEDGQYTVVAVEWSGLQSPSPHRDRPPAPRGLHGAACSPYAVSLAWQGAADADVSYYNVYCSPERTVAAEQANRIASPTQSQLIDWGLQSGNRYHYLVTAVDRAGSESPPCAPVAVETPGVDRVWERIPVDQPLGTQAKAISVRVPRDDRYLLWLELQAGRVQSNRLLVATLDRSRPIYWKPTWEFVSVGHDDPQSVPFSEVLKRDGHADPWFTLEAGEHRVSLSLPSGTAKIISLTVTNDAGFVPQGVNSFRLRP